ncbi:MAG: stage II sporulation protein M [Bacillota bacterium]
MRKSALFSPLVFCVLLFVVGTVMGGMGLRVLSVDEKAELVSYLEVFLQGIHTPGLEPNVIFRLSLLHNLKTAALVWGFGLAVIGVPLTCLMLLLKGFVIGFSSSFVISEVTKDGALLFLSGILPHTLISAPATVALATLSISFSLALFRERPWNRGTLWSKTAGYTLRCLVLAGAMALASFVEGYITPHLLNRLTAI